MAARKQKIISAAVLIISLSALLSYFVKPKPPLLELVLPEQELSSYEAHYPGDTTLADRVVKSYRLAMVLVQSPYTQRNVISLENIRSWARERFQSQPDFLHPAILSVPRESHDTVFGAIGYNLFTGLKYWLEDSAGELLRFQIARFHNTGAYESFASAYFDFFGEDSDAASLLARYQSDRARLAVDVVLFAFSWLCASVLALCAVVVSRGKKRVERVRRVVGAGWLLLGLSYFSAAWTNNEVASLVSALVSGGIGAYLLYPFVIASHEEAGPRLLRICLSSQWIALATWFSFSLISIQILTWIRSGLPSAPDPITLLLSSLSGNFIHDPISGKRALTIGVAVSWIAVSLWTVRQQKRDIMAQEEAAEELAALPSAYALEQR